MRTPFCMMRAPSGRIFEIYWSHERDILLRIGWEVVE